MFSAATAGTLGFAGGSASGEAAGGTTIEVPIVGRAGVPEGAVAALLNFTAVRGSGPGHLTAYPCGEPQPLASTVNFMADEAVANSTIVKLGAGGSVCVYATTSVDVVVDIGGFYPAGSDYVPQAPERLLDTRLSTTSPSIPSSPAPTSPVPSGGFVETFDTPASLDGWQTLVHHRNVNVGASSGATGSWPGDHDAACGGAGTQRTVHAENPSESIYWCRQHVMTSMGHVDGYSMVVLAPPRSFSGARRVCWDVNLTDLGDRQWPEVVILPEALYQANGGRIDYIDPTHQDKDDSALPYDMSTIGVQHRNGRLWVFTDRTLQYRDGNSQTFFTDDKASRFQHCVVDNGNGTLTVRQARPGGDRVVTVPGEFPDAFRVLIKDHNYTPNKACDGMCPGYTWHWDNIIVQ